MMRRRRRTMLWKLPALQRGAHKIYWRSARRSWRRRRSLWCNSKCRSRREGRLWRRPSSSWRPGSGTASSWCRPWTASRTRVWSLWRPPSCSRKPSLPWTGPSPISPSLCSSKTPRRTAPQRTWRSGTGSTGSSPWCPWTSSRMRFGAAAACGAGIKTRRRPRKLCSCCKTRWSPLRVASRRSMPSARARGWWQGSRARPGAKSRKPMARRKRRGPRARALTKLERSCAKVPKRMGCALQGMGSVRGRERLQSRDGQICRQRWHKRASS
mmetsp:Transcript_78025/g.187061  ORF Transcript_78025/g.187061 Transcript_78025/m.187061 type:complete len:269 (-) Transcript_78025:386-1192(-)